MILDCTCLHGECNEGRFGDGLCKRCYDGYWKVNCDTQTTRCPGHAFCHAHAMCITTAFISHYSCVCLPGYTGSGTECEEIDPCALPERGHCHQQALCTTTGPGTNNCTCNRGYTGDGTYCYPASSCRNHSSCHKYASCLEATPGQHICQCKPGYHGDGKSCILINRCTENNGGCHPMARCKAQEVGKVICTCPADLGFSGNGHYCYANLVDTILNHPSLTYMANVLKQLRTAELQLLLDGNYTIFAPNNDAMNKFSRKYSIHWTKVDSMITLTNYHTLPMALTLEQLMPISDYKTQLETMAEGFFIHLVFTEPNQYSVVSGRNHEAKILEADIFTTNGYLNIIDMVLEPYEPVSEDELPELADFFQNHPQYSIFWRWLQNHNMTGVIEDLDYYTLFVPSNDVIKKEMNRTVTKDFLRYYIVPEMLMAISLKSEKQVRTLLGSQYQLVYKVYGLKNITINDVQIRKMDMLTSNGVVNEVSGLLHPVLHQCDEVVKVAEYGRCFVCSHTYHCPEGYLPLHSKYSHQEDCIFFSREDNIYPSHGQKGCKGLCYRHQVIRGCCGGYYGPDCKECPGGPETPCSGHGTCGEGINGTGFCECFQHFIGKACERCIPGWAGSNCDIDKSSCQYRNGGCHANAVCSEDGNGNRLCKCSPGYRGDGYNCTGPCDINNGGCDEYAICAYKVAGGVSCKCMWGFVGDGKTCNADVYSTLMKTNKTSLFLKALKKAGSDKLVHRLQTFHNETYTTAFVPVDDGMKNLMFNQRTLQQQFVNSFIILDSKNFPTDSGMTLTSLSGDKLTINFDPKTNKFTINQTNVIRGVIMCTNGIIYLTSGPFTRLSASRSDNSVDTGTIVGPIMAVVVLATIVGVAVYVHRKYQIGYWKLLQSWRLAREDSDDSNQQAPLHFSDTDDDVSRSGLPTGGNTNFGNPLYKADDLE